MDSRVLGIAAVAATLLTAPPAAPRVEARDIQIGAVVGVHEPIDQDDATNDAVLGARVRYPLSSSINLEVGGTRFDMDSGPYRVRGVPQEVQTWSLTGATVGLTYGRDMGTSQVHPFATVGAGYYFQRKNESPDSETIGFFGAVGINVALRESISADVAVGMTRVALDNGGARALLTGTVAINYHFELR